MPCCAVWERCAVDLSPEGLAGLELQKMGDSEQHSTVPRPSEHRPRLEIGQQFTLAGPLSERG